jgi:integrase
MASYSKRRNQDRTTSIVATVSIKGFKRTSKAFETREAAHVWAEALERELYEQRDRGGLREDAPTLTVATLVKEYLDDPETRALRTYDSVEPLLTWWSDKYGTERVMALNVLTLRAARDRLMPGHAAGTINRYLSAMRSCWNFGRRSGLIPGNHLWPDGLMLTEPRGRTRFLNDKELIALLAAAREHSAVMHAAITVSIACGLRQSELLKLAWKDCDLKHKTLRIADSKNTESRAVHLPKSAAEALQALKKAPVVNAAHVFMADDTTPMDQHRLISRWRRIRRAAKLADFKWHDLRHSCASFLAQAGGSLPEIAHVLGHKSTLVAARYSHLVAGRAVTGHRELDKKLRTALDAPKAKG